MQSCCPQNLLYTYICVRFITTLLNNVSFETAVIKDLQKKEYLNNGHCPVRFIASIYYISTGVGWKQVDMFINQSITSTCILDWGILKFIDVSRNFDDCAENFKMWQPHHKHLSRDPRVLIVTKFVNDSRSSSVCI